MAKKDDRRFELAALDMQLEETLERLKVVFEEVNDDDLKKCYKKYFKDHIHELVKLCNEEA